MGKTIRQGRDTLRLTACLGILLSLGAMGLAAASPPSLDVSTGSGAPDQWAYGAATWYNTTSITSTYTLHEVLFYGSQVVTTATNTSSSTIELKGYSATAFTESYVYCAPNCTHPSSSYYNLSLDEWSSVTSFVNVTSSATVYENNSTPHSGWVAEPAYGISNATWIEGSNYSETYMYKLQGTTDYTGSDFSQSNSTYQVAFDPDLGLIPWNLSKNLTWNSTSSDTASYLDTSNYSVSYNGLHNYSIRERGTAFTQWNIPETESVTGVDHGNSTLASGANVTNISLGFTGAFDVADGLFGTPVSQDLFGGATGNWSVGVVAGALARTASLSVVSMSPGGPFRVVASVTSWSAPIRMIGIEPGSYAALPQPIASTPSGSSQAEPESVPFAQSQAKCLVNSCGGAPVASMPTTGAGTLALPDWGFVVIGSSTIALLVALALYWRRRAKPSTPSEGPTEAPPKVGSPPERS